MINQRGLIAIVSAFVLLGVLYYFTNRSRSSLDESGGFVDLVEGPISTEEVFSVTIRKGQSGGFTLAKRGDEWFMPSHSDAPANVNKLRTLLGNLESAEGEVRSEVADVLADYQLGDDQAIQLLLQNESGANILHLLIGKQSGSGGFVRRAGSDQVLRLSHNLLSDFGVWGEEITEPERNAWIELTAFRAERDSIESVELNGPDGLVSMVKEFEAASPAAVDSLAPPAAPLNYEWRVQKPRSFMAKKTSADGIVGSLVNLRARDVVGPAVEDSLGVYGLGDAADRVVLRMRNGDEHVLLFGAPKGEDQFYFQVAGKPLVWSMPSYLRTNIFKDANELKPD